MVKAIIFDCYGVLLTEAWDPFCDTYLSNNRDQARILGSELNLGTISYDLFIEKVARLANLTPEFTRNYIDSSKVNTKLFSLIIEKLKPHYKIAMLSNAGDNWLGELFTQQQLDLFDDTVLSCDVGITKPDKRIFELSVGRLGQQLNEAVLVDDAKHNVNGAIAAGMQAILYTNFEQFKKDLTKLLG